MFDVTIAILRLPLKDDLSIFGELPQSVQNMNLSDFENWETSVTRFYIFKFFLH